MLSPGTAGHVPRAYPTGCVGILHSLVLARNWIFVLNFISVQLIMHTAKCLLATGTALLCPLLSPQAGLCCLFVFPLTAKLLIGN